MPVPEWLVSRLHLVTKIRFQHIEEPVLGLRHLPVSAQNRVCNRNRLYHVKNCARTRITTQKSPTFRVLIKSHQVLSRHSDILFAHRRLESLNLHCRALIAVKVGLTHLLISQRIINDQTTFNERVPKQLFTVHHERVRSNVRYEAKPGLNLEGLLKVSVDVSAFTCKFRETINQPRPGLLSLTRKKQRD